MSLDTATGEITGTPTATGTTNFKVFAYNQYAASIKDVTINVIDLDDWKYSMDLILPTMKYTGQGSDRPVMVPILSTFDNLKNQTLAPQGTSNVDPIRYGNWQNRYRLQGSQHTSSYPWLLMIRYYQRQGR